MNSNVILYQTSRLNTIHQTINTIQYNWTGPGGEQVEKRRREERS